MIPYEFINHSIDRHVNTVKERKGKESSVGIAFVSYRIILSQQLICKLVLNYSSLSCHTKHHTTIITSHHTSASLLKYHHHHWIPIDQLIHTDPYSHHVILIYEFIKYLSI